MKKDPCIVSSFLNIARDGRRLKQRGQEACTPPRARAGRRRSRRQEGASAPRPLACGGGAVSGAGRAGRAGICRRARADQTCTVTSSSHQMHVLVFLGCKSHPFRFAIPPPAPLRGRARASTGRLEREDDHGLLQVLWRLKICLGKQPVAESRRRRPGAPRTAHRPRAAARAARRPRWPTLPMKIQVSQRGSMAPDVHHLVPLST